VFRVFQESLTNVARHAQATTVSATVQAVDGAILLAIHDDGQGFDPVAIAHKHSLGLAGMRERVQAFAGTLTLTSQPGQGTTVQVNIPLEGPAAAEPPARSGAAPPSQR
jgi:signal transduction histidine kinase